MGLIRQSGLTLRGCARTGPGQSLMYPVPVARKMLLQFALKDIGQLTDLLLRPAIRPG
jgi:hypothetical protein